MMTVMTENEVPDELFDEDIPSTSALSTLRTPDEDMY
jgi:hypothetical protein